MKKVIVVAVLCLIAFVSGFSQTKQESIKVLFRIMETDSLMARSFNNIIKMQIPRMQAEIKDSAMRVQSQVMLNNAMVSLKSIMKKMVDEDMVAIYDKYFTQAEINDYIAFYKSPSGQKFLKVTPDIQKDLMGIMMQKYLPEIQKSIMGKKD